MTTLHEFGKRKKQSTGTDTTARGSDRRETRRHDLETHRISIERWDAKRRSGEPLGEIVDISSGGVRIRADQSATIRPEHQLRVRIELPNYAGICPFVDTSANTPEPKNEWIGWMSVARVLPLDSRQMEIAGRLVDMEEMDRGMLGLYLSTQPLAA